MGETYYDVLGVDQDATQDEIQTAYRDRVLETHPDHNDDADAAEQFTRVRTAQSVLTDEAERARYDRLGHESYMRFARYSDDATAADSDDRDESSATTDADRSATAEGDRAASDGSRDRTDSRTNRRSHRATGERRSRGAAGRSADGSGGRSHHARQRYRRHQQTSDQRSAGGWPFDGDHEQTSERDAGTAHQTRSTTDETETEFSYAVHGWEGEIDLGTNRQRLDQSTIINLGSIALVYPLLVYGSLSPAFSLLTNAIVACCLLLLVGYTLTFPRVAVAIFGVWSLLLPAGLAVSPLEPFSIYGLLAIACCWIPFGYAVAVWWAIQP